jgi:hypothetical protein
MGRATQGVKIMERSPGEVLVALARMAEYDAGSGAEGDVQ